MTCTIIKCCLTSQRYLHLLFTETDSLCYHVKNKDPFENMLTFFIYVVMIRVIKYLLQRLIKLLVKLKKSDLSKIDIIKYF